jgi:hypothetical protein
VLVALYVSILRMSFSQNRCTLLRDMLHCAWGVLPKSGTGEITGFGHEPPTKNGRSGSSAALAGSVASSDPESASPFD